MRGSSTKGVPCSHRHFFEGQWLINGGNWGNGANAGLFYLNVNNDASNSNTNIGGRLANDYCQKAGGLRASVQRISFGAIVLTMLSKMNRALRPVAGKPANVAVPDHLPEHHAENN